MGESKSAQGRSIRSLPLVLAVVAGVMVTAFAGAALLPDGSSGSAAADLTDEFVGAYPATTPATGEVVEVLLQTQIAAIDVVETGATAVWTYNGQVPGPEIRVRLGDTVRATLVNGLPESTTIHWHGVRVPNDMDGVPAVNQEPVEPGEAFVYEFTPTDAGTFWYHSHTRGSEQLERGLYGSLIVEEPEPFGYSEDVTWMIDDWLLEADGRLVEQFRQPHDVTHNGRWGNIVTANARLDTVLRAAPGERIRLRLVNASNARTYAPDFGALDVDVIAVDGMLVGAPFDASGFVLAPGSRIDVDLVVPAADEPAVVFDNFNGEGFAIGSIISEGDPIATSQFPVPTNPAVPDWTGAVDADADHSYVVSLGRAGDGWPQWRFNGDAFPDGEPMALTEGEFNKIQILNDSQVLHPIHLHGQFFKVVTRNGVSVDEDFFRDTVLLMPGETIEIGLVALDAGTWALHCHIQEHADAGMMTTFTVSA